MSVQEKLQEKLGGISATVLAYDAALDPQPLLKLRAEDKALAQVDEKKFLEDIVSAYSCVAETTGCRASALAISLDCSRSLHTSGLVMKSGRWHRLYPAPPTTPEPLCKRSAHTDSTLGQRTKEDTEARLRPGTECRLRPGHNQQQTNQRRRSNRERIAVRACREGGLFAGNHGSLRTRGRTRGRGGRRGLHSRRTSHDCATTVGRHVQAPEAPLFQSCADGL